MINLEYYDRDMVNPLPHVFDNGIAVMTPPKNASSYIQLYYGRNMGRPTIMEKEPTKTIAVKRDPIDRWCGAINQQKSRMRWNSWEDASSDIKFWDRDPNELVDFGEYFRDNISEFCSQYTWAGSMTEYDDSFYLEDVDRIVLPMLGVIPEKNDNALMYMNKSTDKKNIVPITEKDLTNGTKQRIMDIYLNDYKYGWC